MLRQLEVYGISLQEYKSLLEMQGGLCAICSGDNTGKPLHVDHEHESGLVRGLLCLKCNTALGLINDDRVVASKMSEYLTLPAYPALQLRMVL
jgi:Autographiviridae endonuclease VII